ncbi:MFS transporter [Phytohabitans sp. LJ34]|uniref:MFS transporter n=1 Tax=Phytohabitans sp. LJ34 TaxID=3452217 RepID=UPI003F89DE6F
MRSDRWLRDWAPDDPVFWERTGRRIARRNLALTILTEHIGFSVWGLWPVLVVFMTPGHGFTLTGADKFLLVTVATLVGGAARLGYPVGLARYGGRLWAAASTAALLVPCALTAVFLHRPQTPLWVFLLLAALTGLGGGSFASSMANVNLFYPETSKGAALGLTAAGGNLGIPAIQLLALFVLMGERGHPATVALVYLPLIVVAAAGALLFMDSVPMNRPPTGAPVLLNPATWTISLLYVGTFGSFIGYSFAFGLVLQAEFGMDPLRAASVTFVGPLLGSLARPLGGRVADRWGGARVTRWVFLVMASATVLVIAASAAGYLVAFLTGFLLLVVVSGFGNGSTYKMIPEVFGAHRHTAAVIGFAGAVGALGGVAVNLAFRFSYQDAAGTGAPTFVGFLALYVSCLFVLGRRRV